MTTRQKLRLQLPHKNTKILKYYYKQLTKIRYSRRANTYNHCAPTSIVSSMASREFLKRWREPKSVLSTGSLFQMLTTLSQKKCDRTEQLLKRLSIILNWWSLVVVVDISKSRIYLNAQYQKLSYNTAQGCLFAAPLWPHPVNIGSKHWTRKISDR